MTDSVRRRNARRLFFDVTAVAVAALAAAVFAVEGYQTGLLTTATVVLSCSLAAVGCAALCWRHRYPVTVAVLLAPLAAVTELVFAAVLIAVYAVAVRRRWPIAVAIVGLHLLATVPYAVVRHPDPTVPVTLAVDAVLLAGATALGTIRRTQLEMVALLRDRAARAEREASRTAEYIRMLERQRLAREMHDVLGHHLSLVSLHAGALEIRPDLPVEKVVQTASTIRANAQQAMNDLRTILAVLRHGGQADELRPQPGLAALDELVAECRSIGTPVEVDNRLAVADVPPPLSRTAYRVVQEGLTNARKHSPAAPVHLRLDRTEADELHVWMRNPLVCQDATPVLGTRSGLVGLVERIDLAGGRLSHGIRRGDTGEFAFHLEAWIPWPK